MAQLIIGLTGGIGSGKTAISDYFAKLGIDVIDADVIAHQITQKNSPLLAALQASFGDWVIDDDGNYNRPAMRAYILANPAMLERLNQIIHPAIQTHIKTQLNQSTSPYTILSAPLLFESNGNKDGLMTLCQHFLVVDVDEKTQLVRASTRDNTNQIYVQTIIDKQIPRDKRLALAKNLAADVVDNMRSLDDLYQQLHPLHQKYLQLANKSQA